MQVGGASRGDGDGPFLPGIRDERRPAAQSESNQSAYDRSDDLCGQFSVVTARHGEFSGGLTL
jgi:hypothetical protein